MATDLTAVPRQRHWQPIPPITLARQLATTAHLGQTDPFGGDLVATSLHPVARRLRCQHDTIQAAAWLRLIVSHTDYTFTTLRVAGVPEPVLALVAAVTPRPAESGLEYAHRVACYRPARLIALAATTVHMLRLDEVEETTCVDRRDLDAQRTACLQVRGVLVKTELEEQL